MINSRFLRCRIKNTGVDSRNVVKEVIGNATLLYHHRISQVFSVMLHVPFYLRVYAGELASYCIIWCDGEHVFLAIDFRLPNFGIIQWLQSLLSN